MVGAAGFGQRVTLARQFMVTHLLTVALAMGVLGWWVGQQISTGVVHRTAAITSLYVDSFVAPNLLELAYADRLSETNTQRLDSLLRATSLGQRIVAFKVWSPEGQVLFSSSHALDGEVFPIGESLRRALDGEIVSHISDLEDEENRAEADKWDRLLETYAPVRLPGSEDVIAVSEFYQLPDELEAEVGAAQTRSWLVVGGVGVVLYVVAAGIVRRGSDTIARQGQELRRRVDELSQLLAQNQRLHDRLRRAAARTTALNERFLRRVSGDLHDGPAQDLSLALLRLDALARRCEVCPVFTDPDRPAHEDLGLIHTALESALQDVREISAGLRIPGLEERTLEEAIHRAVREHERKTGDRVSAEVGPLPTQAPEAVKITIYRLLQEALSNAHRHAPGAEVAVKATAADAHLHLEIEDRGPGFDPESNDGSPAHLGLAVMRERVEMLGGALDVDSRPGKGSRLTVRLPLEG